ncbi:MGDG synthase family glycosyltransferase [Paenibacillus pini]|uniref:1,2-diacylglycerol 3-glucosyltransferase n=1 Tax=Paenibacillus pini JCM 16418 TaxID=1236976 RepID=W7Z7P0_9BACL|nr:glycosyltransferase [Paenibacillus pini]GAF10419.1 1,2-diacylglycerol 3-glucosyltransferase [Paenibacillus pini JCM 16418]
MQKKRVLILSEGFGSGHTQAGYALAEGMKKINPQIHTKVIELGTFLNPTVAPMILSAYRLTLSTQPGLVGMIYRKQHAKPLNRLTGLALHRIFYHHAAEVIRHLKPDMIVCTHPIPNTIISRLKAAGLNIPLYTVITDYDAHGAWINPAVDRYLVSTQSVRNLLLEHGVRTPKIQVTGIPVHPKFWTIEDKAACREEMNLKPLPTVLIMGGGWGLMSNKSLFQHLHRWKDRVQLVFCTGNNQKLMSKLANDPAYDHPNITIVGQTKEINRWMDAADLLITKPGGMTCTEGLSKGLPMLFCKSIPGQEEKNCEYFVNHGYAEELTSSLILDKWLTKIVAKDAMDTSELKRHISDASIRNLFTESYSPNRCAKELVELLVSDQKRDVAFSAEYIPVSL